MLGFINFLQEELQNENHPHLVVPWVNTTGKSTGVAAYHDAKTKVKTYFEASDKHDFSDDPKNGAGHVVVSFKVGGEGERKYGPKKNMNAVFGSVSSHIRHFIKQNRPVAFYFQTADEKQDRLYRKLGKRFGVPFKHYNEDNK